MQISIMVGIALIIIVSFIVITIDNTYVLMHVKVCYYYEYRQEVNYSNIYFKQIII